MNREAELAAALDGLVTIVERVGCGDWRNEHGQRLKDTEQWVTAYLAATKKAQPAVPDDVARDAALAEHAAVDCLRACAQAMRIFDRPDTAAEVDRATDAIAAALRARTAVPDALAHGDVDPRRENFQAAFARWWNACRRAMLAASKEAK